MTKPESLQDATLDRAAAAAAVREGGGGDPRALALAIADAADDVKAQDIVLIDVASAVGYADWFVLCTGNSDRQTRAIHDTVLKAIKDDLRIIPKRAEGVTEARWILLDYVDVVLHVFTPDARDYYRLDRLYGDLPSETYDAADRSGPN